MDRRRNFYLAMSVLASAVIAAVLALPQPAEADCFKQCLGVTCLGNATSWLWYSSTEAVILSAPGYTGSLGSIAVVTGSITEKPSANGIDSCFVSPNTASCSGPYDVGKQVFKQICVANPSNYP